MRVRRGITPVVAIILLLILTIAAVGGATAWFSGIIGQAKADAERAFYTDLEVKDIQCEAFRVSVALKNSGERQLSEGKADVYVYHDGELLMHKEQDLSGKPFLEPRGFGFAHFFFDQVLRSGMVYTVEIEFPFEDYSVESTCTTGTHLVNYWRFDEGDGQRADDSAGANHGVLGNTTDTEWTDPQWESNCITGNCLAFDGEGTYVNITSLGRFESNMNGEITVSAWVRIDEDTGDVQQVIETRTAGWEFFMETDGNMPYSMDFQVTNDTGHRHEVTAGTYETGNWHHFTGTLDNDKLRLYVDGELEDETDWKGTFNITTSGKIGRDDEADIQPFAGLIDEVRLYDHALPGDAVATRYEEDLDSS